MRRVFLASLGCKTNQYESAAIEQAILAQGHTMVARGESADVCVINSCTVTGYTDYQCRQLVRRCQRANPQAAVIVTGCYAQAYGEKVGQLPGIDYIIGNSNKATIPQLIATAAKRKSPQYLVTSPSSGPIFAGASCMPGRTRALVKIQDGCDSFCSYCIVPYARGRSRSLPAEEVKREVIAIEKKGFKEVVLTGIHLGSYGKDLGNGVDFSSLVGLLVKEFPDLRIRLSSLEPQEVTPELIELMSRQGNLCPHLHLSLQSGDNSVLRRMRRGYEVEEYISLIRELADQVPDICLGADIIAGFPGESEAGFNTTYQLLAELPLSYLHVFPYSLREGTAAASFPDQLDPRVIKKRAGELGRLAATKKNGYLARFQGKIMPVLIEGSRDKQTGRFKGLSRNYLTILMEGDDSMVNEEVLVKVSRVEGEKLTGQLVGKT